MNSIGLHSQDWQKAYDKKIDEYYSNADTRHTIVYVEIPKEEVRGFTFRKDKHPEQQFEKECVLHIKTHPKPIPALEDPRLLTKQDSEFILGLLEEENNNPKKYFFIVTWRWFLNHFPN